MASNLQGKSPVRKNSSLSPIPLNSMHTTTGDFFRWHCVKLVNMVQNDSISFSDDCFLQGAPNPFPINGSCTYAMHAFFVPNRLVWSDWKYYITGLQDGLTPPYFTIGDLVDVFNDSSVAWHEDERSNAYKFLSDIDNLSSVMHFVDDYSSSENVPVKWRNLKLSAMPLRAINLLWFDWMRDKMHISDNAKDSYCFTTGGHITMAELALLCAPRYRNYPKNIFTASFDSPQDGSSSVQAVRIADSVRNPDLSAVEDVLSEVPAGMGYYVGVGNGGTDVTPKFGVGIFSNISPQEAPGAGSAISLGSNANIGQFGINDLRFANSLQQYAERVLVAGKTVLSRALALFGVSPTIEELQMSNWLGGHEKELNFNTHLSNASTTNGGSSQPTQAGAFGLDPRYANISGQKAQTMDTPSDGFGLQNISYRTDESGMFIVMGCITPNVQYYQGLPKNWTRGLDTFASDRFDFFHSDFENQPLESVLNYQICADPAFEPKGVFGFQLQYSDYKQAFDSLGGDFIQNAGNALLKDMHLGRDIFGYLESLAIMTGKPITELLTPEILRQSNVLDQFNFDQKFTISEYSLDHFILNHKFNINMLRPMQLFCLPSLDSDLSKVTSKDIVDTGGFSV